MTDLALLLALDHQADRYVDQIRGRLLAEQARDLSDVELDRCLAPCVLGAFCIRLAQHIRDTRGGNGLELTCLMDHAGHLPPSVLRDALVAVQLLERLAIIRVGVGGRKLTDLDRANSDSEWRIGLVVHTASIDLRWRDDRFTLMLLHAPSGDPLLRTEPASSVSWAIDCMRKMIRDAFPPNGRCG